MNTSYSDLLTFCANVRFLEGFLAAESALSRLDERVKNSDVARGWQSRILFLETLACRLAEGDLVHLEDLVLFDRGSLARAGRIDLMLSLEVLRAWRQAASGDAAALLRSPQPGMETKRIIAPYDDEGQVVADGGASETLRQWRCILREAEAVPALLQAAVAWDAWLELAPEEGGGWRAPLIGSLVLKTRRPAMSFLAPIDLGRRKAEWRRRPGQNVMERLLGFMIWIEAGAVAARKELEQLQSVGERLRAFLKGKRRHSRLSALIDLLLAYPVVSLPMAAREIGCTQAAAGRMLRQLGSYPREETGYKRYRVWRV